MTDGERHAAFLRIVAAAASPDERADCRGLRAIDTPADTRESRRSAWVAAAAGDPDRFAAVLRARGIDDQRLQAMLSDVEAADETALPRWAEALRELLQRIVDAESPQAAAAETVLYEAFTPWLAMGRIDAVEAARGKGFELSDRALDGMLHSLTRRIFNAVGLPLQQQLRLAEIAAGTPFSPNRDRGRAVFAEQFATAAGWIELLESLPVAARLIAVAYDHWRSTLSEMLGRLGDDLDSIAAEVTGCSASRVIDAFTGDAGDIHAHGRSVILLAFDGGARVVYKPKDLRIAPWFHDLAEALGTTADLPMRRRRILLRDRYAWEECVEKSTCSTAGEIERYYTRLGALLAILQSSTAAISGSTTSSHRPSILS